MSPLKRLFGTRKREEAEALADEMIRFVHAEHWHEAKRIRALGYPKLARWLEERRITA